jgi:hypothetical protein
MTEKFAGSGCCKAGFAAALVSLIGLGSAAWAQEEAATTTVEVTTAQPGEPTAAETAAGPIEEVIVRAQRPLSALVQEGAELTEDFYSRLNEVLENEDFRIECRNEFPTGSRLSVRRCTTRFQDRLLNRQSVSIIQGLGSTEDGQPIFNDAVYDIEPEMRRLLQEFEDAMVVAVNDDPMLNQQVLRLMALKSAVQNYQTPRQQRREAE